MMHLFCFGAGYVAKALSKSLQLQSWDISASYRTTEMATWLRHHNIHPVDITQKGLEKTVSHILLSAPPNTQGQDPALSYIMSQSLPNLQWVGYLSTTSVYGNHKGSWVDETTPPKILTNKGKRRLLVEQAWQNTNLPIHYFRLSGIYGSQRNVLKQLEQGSAKRVYKKGQVFSRIHVDDIVQILSASMTHPNIGRIYNLCDHFPAPSHEVTEFAAKLMNVTPPPLVDIKEADLSPIAKSFYADNKRVHNKRIQNELNITLLYPSYKEGLTALWKTKAY